MKRSGRAACTEITKSETGITAQGCTQQHTCAIRLQSPPVPPWALLCDGLRPFGFLASRRSPITPHTDSTMQLSWKNSEACTPPPLLH